MKHLFQSLFTGEPQKTENGIPYFGNEKDGDWFEESDFAQWRNGAFLRSWNNDRLLTNPASRHLLDEIIRDHDYLIDLACGPGMGFIPSVKRLSPSFPCLATDANPHVLNEWKGFLDGHLMGQPIDFAQFSVFDIPLKSKSVQTFSSFIGLSNSRGGEKGFASALSEIHRTLADDGSFYAVESEWSDIEAILECFNKMGRRPYNVFLEKQIPWHDRFYKSGFEIIYEEPFDNRSLRSDDNELGAAAVHFGINIEIKLTAFIVRKG